MSEIKVGSKVVSLENDYSGDIKKGSIYIVEEVLSKGSEIAFRDDEGTLRRRVVDNYKLVGKSFETLEPGDIIVDDNDNELEVVLANEKYILTKDIYDKSDDLNGWDVDWLRDHSGYTIKGVDDTKEVSLQEVAEKFGVDVKKIRIKE